MAPCGEDAELTTTLSPPWCLLLTECKVPELVRQGRETFRVNIQEEDEYEADGK